MLLSKKLNPQHVISITRTATKPSLFQLFSKLARMLDTLLVDKISPLRASVLMPVRSTLSLMEKTVPLPQPPGMSLIALFNQQRMSPIFQKLTKVKMEPLDTLQTPLNMEMGDG